MIGQIQDLKPLPEFNSYPKPPDEQGVSVTWLKSRGWKVVDDGMVLSRHVDGVREWCVVRKNGESVLII